MTEPSPYHQWLLELASIPTTSGREWRVVAWIKRWVAERPELELTEDAYGNLLITVGSGSLLPASPVVAVAHMDHPGFVVESIDGMKLTARFMGGVLHQYFPSAHVELFDADDNVYHGMVVSHDPDASISVIETKSRPEGLAVGDVGRWRFPERWLGVFGDRFRAHGCDDLAGVAAILAAVDQVRLKKSDHRLAALLTRAEEEGFIGAIAACKSGTVPAGSRVLSVETSRELPEAPMGFGPIIRVGDRASVFDHGLSNAVSEVAAGTGLEHQRRLMTGGACEATAFGAYGYTATGLALALGGYHNMGDIDGVRDNTSFARLTPEEISLADFDGLVTMLVAIASDLDEASSPIHDRLDARFEKMSHLLG